MSTVRECSFCAGGEAEVQRLVAGPAACICDECLDLCNDILAELPPTEASRHPTLVCSFCDKDNRRYVVAGPKVYVCDECVARFSN